jgi:hypothetical protein
MAKSWLPRNAALAAPTFFAALLLLGSGGPASSPYLIHVQGSATVFSTDGGVGSGGLAGSHATPMVAPYGDITGRGTNADKPLTPPAPPPAGTQLGSVPTFSNDALNGNDIGGNGFGTGALSSGVGSSDFGGSLPTLNSNPGH